MNSTDVPTRFPIPFANAAGGSYIRPIPTASQVGIQDGAASLTDGFPPDCFIPIGGGGVPPFGQDVNGLLNQISAWCRWQGAGGPVIYNAAFATAVSGYPKGAVLQSSALAGIFWISTVDGNVTDPDGSLAANWTACVLRRATAAQVIAGADDTVAITPKALRNASNWVKGVTGFRVEPDGFMTQWVYSGTWPTPPADLEAAFTINWPVPFPNVVIRAQVVVINGSLNIGGDTTVQEVSLALDHGIFFAQSHIASSNDRSGYRCEVKGY